MINRGKYDKNRLGFDIELHHRTQFCKTCLPRKYVKLSQEKSCAAEFTAESAIL